MSRTSDYEPEKIYWSIGEIAKELHCSQSSIRYWLDLYGIQIHRTRLGDRSFSLQDRELMHEIHRLLKDEGYTRRGAHRQLLKSNKWKIRVCSAMQEPDFDEVLYV
jgi:DNA-binding transcriptional MerR regulator